MIRYSGQVITTQLRSQGKPFAQMQRRFMVLVAHRHALRQRARGPALGSDRLRTNQFGRYASADRLVRERPECAFAFLPLGMALLPSISHSDEPDKWPETTSFQATRAF
jgi:hypothetical protein